ncbi:MAG TPA: DUF3300 domain-containing protein [Burkholderiaceae bacterium]|nr:DUF3300 domain-containing protein [Burkholderiaceae bacterium]
MRPFSRGLTLALFLAVAPGLVHAQATSPAAKPPPIAASAPRGTASATFNQEQLEQLVAPIALYPDSLLSQVLMAATYPVDVAEAAKWSKANKDMKGDAAVQAVQNQPWDPSVQSLAAFPQVLQAMGDQPDWVQNLGDAFLASSKDVLDAVQRLRAKAQSTGNLKTNDQQKVIVEEAAPQQIIKIEPAQPDTIYVPAYDPAVVYGPWPYPYYPPYYWPPYPYYYPGYYPGAFAAGVFWGAAIGAIVWGGCNWRGGDVNINVDNFNRVNHNRQLDRSQTKFQHNAANRKGVPYRDQASRDKFGGGRGGAEARNNFRGRDPVTEARRQQAQSTLQNRGMDPAQARDALRNDPATRQRAQTAAQGARDRGSVGGGDRGGQAGGGRDGGLAGAGGGRDGGFSNVSASRDRAQALGGNDHALRGANNPGQSRQQFDRGSASRQSSMANRGGGGFSGGGRGGGGGGGGRGGGGRR